MFNRYAAIVTLVLAPSTAFPQVTVEQMTETVLQLCSGGNITGESSSFEVGGSGNVQILKIKNITDVGLDAEIQLTQDEWDGIQAFADRDQTAYHECVSGMLSFFDTRVARFELIETGVQGEVNTSTGDGNNVGGSGNVVNNN